MAETMTLTYYIEACGYMYHIEEAKDNARQWIEDLPSVLCRHL